MISGTLNRWKLLDGPLQRGSSRNLVINFHRWSDPRLVNRHFRVGVYVSDNSMLLCHKAAQGGNPLRSIIPRGVKQRYGESFWVRIIPARSFRRPQGATVLAAVSKVFSGTI